MTKKCVMLFLLLTWLAMPSFGLAAQNGVNFIDKDTLKGMVGDPQVLIIDVRVPNSWDESDRKIKGALRQDPGRVSLWGPALPKDKKIVLYCS